MSRSGGARKGETKTGTLSNVSFITGDCLQPSSFKDELEDVDAIVHTVGALVEMNGMSYNAHNRDSCVNMAYELQKHAKKADDKRNFVMLSSAKAPFFAPRYLSSKLEAEKYLLEECSHLRPTIIRPGVILNSEHRWWGTPVGAGNDLLFWMDRLIFKNVLPKGVADATDFLIPARSTKLTTIEHFTKLGIHGENENPCIIGPDEYIAYEKQ